MTTRQLETALEKVRQLPKERQAAAVTAIEIIASDDYLLTSSEVEGVQRARSAVHAGKYADDAAVAAFFRKFSV